MLESGAPVRPALDEKALLGRRPLQRSAHRA